MDPASSVIGIVSFGFTVIGKVDKIRKEIKGAPQQVRALEESYVVVRVLLGKLKALNTHAVTYTKDALACFELLYERAQMCLHDVDIAVKKVLAKTPAVEARSPPQVRLRQWFLNKSDLEDLAKKMKEVREALGAMIDLMQLNHLQFIAIHVTNDMRPSNLPSPDQSFTVNSLNASRHTGIVTLQCDHNCMCRCHARSLSSVIPRSLTPYLGQLLISKQLLHPACTFWNCCNVTTCRGTFLNAAKVSWILPRLPFHGSFQMSSNLRIHFSINAHRTIPYSSPIIQAVWNVDIQGVRDLFAKQQASIWDVDIHGDPVFWHACDVWQAYPSEASLEIIRFLVEAGADTLLFADTGNSYSAHDILALGLLPYLLHKPRQGRSLAPSLQTNKVAIDVFRSIFNIDPMDALGDLFTRHYGHSDEDVSHILASLQTTEYTVARSSVFGAIWYTPLQYAIAFSPSNVEHLLAEGADASAEPTLACAVRARRADLVQLLIDKGAGVNMQDSRGRTALHWACYYCSDDEFFGLLRCAKDSIDWDARMPEGQNALDMLELGVSEGQAWHLTSAQIDEFHAALISHMDTSQLDRFGNQPWLDMPGAFPVTT